MRIIGIDTSLASTGVATLQWSDHSGTVTANTYAITTKGKRADTLWDRNARLHHITGEIQHHVTPDAELVVIESGAFSRVGGSNWDRAGLWWRVVELLLHEHAVATIPPTSLKKWATDRGNADKSDVSVAMARLWPDVDAPSNDAWDALALAHMGAQRLGWPVPTRAHHAAARAKGAWPDLEWAA